MAKNPFPGVNPYLNSVLLQPGGGWEMFHAAHVIQIQQALDAVLPDNYYAAPEKSLQIGLIDASLSQMKPDVGVYDRGVERDAAEAEPASVKLAEPVLALPLAVEEVDLNAVNVYRTSGEGRGELVCRVELLSPANMPGGSYHHKYLAKRKETQVSGIHMVELDYLHTMHPVIAGVPSYVRRDEGALPYYVIVSDLRPTVHRTLVFGAVVDAPLPAFEVPLAGDEGVVLNLQDVYDRTFESAKVFSVYVNYSKPLPNADAYTEADQQRIAEIIEKTDG
ncbi:MAG: DUF4058 family protein [Chloroflexota bacterium]